ncbi:PfkB family carbohydrate kinase [Streptomyces sp. NPDC097619]|uniref:carbohydrate kinase family protein n=1 Tax=Streptomyces sp. NPDC097619 TaxID=3157228 RepID=UPI00331BC03C
MTAPGGGALLVVGDVITDVVAVHAGPLVPATDTAASIRTLPGGAGANAACWAAYAGLDRVGLLARVGGDDTAGWHERALTEAGVRPLLVRDAQAPTGTVISLVDGTAERTFLTDGGAALRLSPADWHPRLLAGTDHLHISGYLFFAEPARELALLALTTAVEQGVPVSVDPASAGFLAARGPGAFLAAVRGASVLLPNADEALLLSAALPEEDGAAGEAAAVAGGTDPVEAAAARLSREVPLVVVTRGSAGAVVAEEGRVTAVVPGMTAAAVDTTGAGDAFTGGFLAARLRGASAVGAARAGCRAGAEAVTRIGGRPG